VNLQDLYLNPSAAATAAPTAVNNTALQAQALTTAKQDTARIFMKQQMEELAAKDHLSLAGDSRVRYLFTRRDGSMILGERLRTTQRVMPIRKVQEWSVRSGRYSKRPYDQRKRIRMFGSDVMIHCRKR
jgi:hypothetical protein